MITGVVVLGEPPTAHSSPPPPTSTISYYVDATTASDMYDLGFSLGQAVADGLQPQASLVVFEFGGQQYYSEWGALSVHRGVFNSDVGIEAYMESFGEGFYYGAGSDTNATVEISIATNNSLTVSGDAGAQWAAVIDAVDNWLENNGPSSFPFISEVYASGGNDIESGFCPGPTCPTDTRSWADSLAYSTLWGWYDYIGDASGCPPYGSCDSPYTIADYEYYAWGNPAAVPLPQIYNTLGAGAEQWERIAEWGHDNDPSRLPMIFDGPLTQAGACAQTHSCSGTDNSPDTGWTQLWDALNTTYGGHTPPSYLNQTPPYSTDIKYLTY
jgi:hypothetical protein